MEKTPTNRICLEKTTLKKFDSADYRDLLNLVNSERHRITSHFGTLTKQVTCEDSAKSYISQISENWLSKKSYFYGVWSNRENKLIGQIQIKNIDWKALKAELAFFISGDSEGKGMMKESIHGVCNLCFNDLKFEKIYLRIDPKNDRSTSLAESLNFVQEGLFRNDHRNGSGELIDVAYYSYFPT